MPIFDSEFPVPVTSTQAAPLWVTGSTGGSSNVNITGSITLPVSATNPVTASIANFPTGFNANITASVILGVSASNPITASISNLPATQSVVWATSAVVTASVSNFPAGQNVQITGTITLPVSATNPITASVSNFPSSFNVGNFPAGFNSNITASIPLNVTSTAGAPVWVTGAVTVNTGTGGGVTGYGTGSAIVSHNTGSLTLGSDGTNLVAIKVDNAGVIAVSSTNSPTFPAGFNSNITQSITLPVSATNPVTASIANFPTGFNVDVTASVPLNVTSTVAAPVWVSGAVIASNLTPLINNFGSTHPQTGLSVTVGEGGIDGNGYTLSVIPTGASNVSVGTLLVTSTLAQPVWTTGTVLIQGTVAVSATNPVTASIVQTGFNSNITGSITLPVSATNPVTASIANFPTGQNVNITGSNVWLSASVVGTVPVSATNPVTASIANFPTGFNVNLTGSTIWVSASLVPGQANVLITGTVPGHDVRITGSNVWLSASVVGTVPVTATAGDPVWVTGTVTVNTGSGGGASGYGTGSLASTGSVVGGIDTANGQFFALRKGDIDVDGDATDNTGIIPVESYVKLFNGTTWDRMRGIAGVTQVTATVAAPIWVTGTITQGNVTANVQYGTGSATPFTGTLILGSDGTNSRAVKTDAAGQVYIANPGGAAAPTSGTNFTISATGTVGGVGLIAANASRKGLTIFNNATTNLYISMGTTATVSSFQVLLVPQAYYEAPFNFTGPVSGAWQGTPTGNALLGEQT